MFYKVGVKVISNLILKCFYINFRK